MMRVDRTYNESGVLIFESEPYDDGVAEPTPEQEIEDIRNQLTELQERLEQLAGGSNG